MRYIMTRQHLDAAYISLEYAIADAAEELTLSDTSICQQVRILLSNIDAAKTVIMRTFDVLGDLEADTGMSP
jgi:hypothetical protein